MWLKPAPLQKNRCKTHCFPFRPPDAFLLLVAFLIQAGFLAGDLFADLVGVVEFLLTERGVQLLLQEIFPLGPLALVDVGDKRRRVATLDNPQDSQRNTAVT